MNALEKPGSTHPAPPSNDPSRPTAPGGDRKPTIDRDLPELVEDLLNKRSKEEARKKAEREKEEAQKKAEREKEETRKKDEEAKQKDAEGFEVGKNMKMNAVWNHGVQFTTEDEAFKFHVGGRVDFDNAWFNAPENMLFGNNDDVGLHDGSDFRRMRLRADGRFWDFVDFVFEVSFANLQDFSNAAQAITFGSVGLTDVNLTFRPLPVVGTSRSVTSCRRSASNI